MRARAISSCPTRSSISAPCGATTALLPEISDAAGWRVLSPRGGLLRPEHLLLRADATAHARARTRAAAAAVAARFGSFLPFWRPR
jgi:hypothetical protein